jgi:plastocyanin
MDINIISHSRNDCGRLYDFKPIGIAYGPDAFPERSGAFTISVTIKSFLFQPEEVTIARGGTVTWANEDDVSHTVRFADEESSALQKGGTYSKKLDSTGSFDYTCGIHPSRKGKVKVV